MQEYMYWQTWNIITSIIPLNPVNIFPLQPPPIALLRGKGLLFYF